MSKSNAPDRLDSQFRNFLIDWYWFYLLCEDIFNWQMKAGQWSCLFCKHKILFMKLFIMTLLKMCTVQLYYLWKYRYRISIWYRQILNIKWLDWFRGQKNPNGDIPSVLLCHPHSSCSLPRISISISISYQSVDTLLCSSLLHVELPLIWVDLQVSDFTPFGRS